MRRRIRGASDATCSCGASFCGAQNRADDPIVAAAAAKIARQCFAHLGFGGMWRPVEQRLGGHDHAVDAIAALHRLFCNERGLQRMRFGFAADAFERGDLTALHAANGGAARTHRRTADDHRAGATLRESAAEFRAGQFQIITKDIEEGRISLDCDVARLAVDAQMIILGHGLLPLTRTSLQTERASSRRSRRKSRGAVTGRTPYPAPRRKDELPVPDGLAEFDLTWARQRAGRATGECANDYARGATQQTDRSEE